jgi:phosphoribosylamine-glycine ligase
LYTKRRIPLPHFEGMNMWVLKATGFNRGRGIHVINKLEELKRLIKEYTDGVIMEN